MKTIAQIAAEIGIPKQRVYRYIKRECITESHQRNGVMYYDEAAETIIKQVLSKNVVSSDVHHDAYEAHDADTLDDTACTMVDRKYLAHLESEIAFLRGELSKTRESLQTGQALHAGTIKKQLQSAEQEKPSKKVGLIARVFNKRF